MHMFLSQSFVSWHGFEAMVADAKSSGRESKYDTLDFMLSCLSDLAECVHVFQPDFRQYSLFGRASLASLCLDQFNSEPVKSQVVQRSQAIEGANYVRCSTLSAQGRIALSFQDGKLQVTQFYLEGISRSLSPISVWDIKSVPPFVWLEFVSDDKRLVGEDVNGMVWLFDDSRVIDSFGPLPAPGPRSFGLASPNGTSVVRVPFKSLANKPTPPWYEQMVLLDIIENHIVSRQLASPTKVKGPQSLNILPRSLGFSPDGKHVGTFDDSFAHIWSTQSGDHRKQWNRTSNLEELIVNPVIQASIAQVQDLRFESAQGQEGSASAIAIDATLVFELSSIDDEHYQPMLTSSVFVRAIASDDAQGRSDGIEDSNTGNRSGGSEHAMSEANDRVWMDMSRQCPGGTIFMHPKSNTLYSNGRMAVASSLMHNLFQYDENINPNDRIRAADGITILLGGGPRILSPGADDGDELILFPPVLADILSWR